MPRYFILISLLLSAHISSALILHDPPVDCETELSSWRWEFEKIARAQVKSGAFLKSPGLISCRRTTQLPNVMICMSFLQKQMNRTFGRASIFAEGGYDLPAGSLAAHDHLDMQKLNITTQGHDLKSRDLEAFFRLVDQECRHHKEFCLSPFEMHLKEIYDHMAQDYSDFVLLGFSFQSFHSYHLAVGHEMTHAQYFLIPAYRNAVSKFWESQVPDDEKAEIRAILAGEAYDPSDEDLMKNEFQAFVLETGAENDRLGKFAVKYRLALAKALTDAGVPPVIVR